LKKLVSALVFATCIPALPAQAEQTVIRLWHSYTAGEREALDLIVKKFDDSNNSLRVEASFVPFNALADKLTAAIPRGHGPDLFIFAHDRIGGWAEGKLLEPIELLVTEEQLDRHLTSCVFALAYGDSLYGLPLAFKALALFTRTDKIEVPPKTSDELVELAKTYTNKEKGEFGFVYPAGDFFFHTPLLYSMNGSIFPKNSKTPDVNNAGVAESLRTAKRIKDLNVLPDDPTPVVASSMFVSGRTPMIINGPWFLDTVQGKVPFRVSAIPPFFEGRAASGFSSCEGVFMSRQSKHKRAAFELMTHLADNPEAAAERMIKGKQTVTLNEAWDRVLPQLNENTKQIYSAFRDAFENSNPSPSFPNMNAVWGPMNAALYNTLHKGAAPKDAAADAQKRIMKALNK